MELGAFIPETLDACLRAEEVLNVEMDPVLAAACKSLEEDITALGKHRGNQSVVSIGLNALMFTRPAFRTWNALRP
jgi:hypothetical protein